MKRFTKWLAIVVAALVVLVVAAVLVLPRVIDPNRYKSAIADAVQSRTGRAMSIQGDLSLTVFPWLGVEVGPLEVGQPPGFRSASLPANAPFLRSDHTRVRVKLLPLLARRVEMDTVSAKGLVVNLARTADGHDNWSDLLGGAGGGGQPPPGAALALGGVALSDATLHWYDAQNDRRYALTKVQVSTGPVSPPAPVDVAVEFDLEAADPALPDQPLAGHVKASSTLSFDPDASTVAASGLSLGAQVRTARGEQAALDASGDALVDLARGAASSKTLKVGVRSTAYHGSAGNVTVTLADVSADPAQGKYAAARVELAGDAAGEVVDGGKVTFQASGALLADVARQVLEVRKLAVSLPSFEYAGATGKLDLAGDLDGALGEQRFDVHGLKLVGDLGGPALAGGTAKVAVEGDLSVDALHRTASSSALSVSVPAFDVAGNAGSLRATGALKADPERQRVSVGGLALDGTLTRGAGFTGALPFQVRGDIDLDLAHRQALAPTVRLETSAFDVDTAKGNLVVELAGARLDLASATVAAKSVEASTRLEGKTAFKGKLAAELRGQELRADAKRASLGSFRLHVPEFDVDGNQGTVDASGALDASLASRRVAVAGLRTSGRLGGRALEGGKVRFEGGADAVYDPAGRFELSKLALALKELEYAGLAGAVDLSGQLSGEPAKRTYSAQGLRARGNLEGKAIPGRKVDFDVTGDARADLAADTLHVTHLVAKAAGVQAEGALDVSALTGQPSYQGNLALAPFNPRPLLERLGAGPVRTADPKALTRLGGHAGIAGGPGRLALKDLVVQLDETTARGSLSWAGAGGGTPRPRLEFDLAVDGVDADRYLAPATAGQKAAAPSSPAAAPLALLASVDVEGQLQVGKLKANNMRITNFKLTARGKDRKLDIDPATASLYQGTVSSHISVDASGPVPAIAAENAVRGVQAGPLLTDLQGKAPVTGTADLDLSVRTQGLTREALLGGANGTTRFALHDGTIQGVNMVRTICGQLTQFGIVSGSAAGGGDATPFSSLSGTGEIRSGVLYNEDMAMTSPFLRVSGAGNYQLLNEQVGYAVTAYLVDSCEGQGRGVVKDLVNVPIPIRIHGPVTNLTYGFDFDRLLQSLASQQIERQGTRLLERALGGKSSAPSGGGTGGQSGSGAGSGAGPSSAPSPEEAIQGILKGLLKRKSK